MKHWLVLALFTLSISAACGPSVTGTVDATGDDDAAIIDADLGPDADLCTGGSLCGTPVACCAAGNECVDDMCLPGTCASGVRCGADLLTCCDAGQVCLGNACTVPGAACADPYDCEPGHFCEPTLSQCLPQPDPLTCKLLPTFGTLQVVTEWSSIVDQVISIPVVANLDNAGPPEVVVNLTQQDGGGYPGGRIQILNGQTGAVLVPKLAHTPPTSYGSHGRSTIATGDVSGDGMPDIVYASRVDAQFKSLIVAIDRTGALLWTSHSPLGAAYPFTIDNAAITLANFDADPQAELVIGATLLDHDGTVLWDQGGNGGGSLYGSNLGYNGGLSAVADLDNDGAPEIVSGKHAWKVAWNAGPPVTATVTPYWTYAGDDGFPGVADLDKDGTPEVVLVANGKVIVLDGQTGSLFCAVDPSDAMCAAVPTRRAQPIAIPGPTTQNRGGPPTVADFDGDGRPEIGVAGGHNYAVYDLNRPGEDVGGMTPAAGQLFVKWQRPTQDKSSNASGSSVFDFQGDGPAEVVYQDECNVWVYSGVDGSTQLQLPHTTGTIHEYPLVVDADGDGNSEILVVANDSNAATDCPGQTATRGVYLYGDPDDRWVPTRKVWTQHTYHVTNSSAVGNVPMIEDANWLVPGLNDYRKNAQGEGVFNAPDLAVELSVSVDNCNAGQLVLKARVTNLGSLGVFPGVTVAFHEGSSTAGPLVGMSMTTTPLLPGGSQTISVSIPAPAQVVDYFVAVDGAPAAGSIAECDELNNVDQATGAMCPVILKR